jgi:hypothetical protein
VKRCAHLLASLLCAWVLWEDVESARGGAKEHIIKPIDAVETRADCRTLLGRRLDEVASRTTAQGWRRTRTSSEFLEISPDGTLSLTVKLTCLPNGTDPRPRGRE